MNCQWRLNFGYTKLSGITVNFLINICDCELTVKAYNYHKLKKNLLGGTCEMLATKSYSEGRKIFFGVIDGQDTARLIAAYPDVFIH